MVLYWFVLVCVIYNNPPLWGGEKEKRIIIDYTHKYKLV